MELFARQKQSPPQKITLHNILNVPSLITTLVSISALWQKGVYWRMDTKNTQFAQCKEIRMLFALDEDYPTRTASEDSTALVTMRIPPLSMDQAHRCFGHLGEANLRKLANVARIEIYRILFPCQACILAKITKTTIRSQLPAQCRSWAYSTMILLDPSFLWNTTSHCISRWPRTITHVLNGDDLQSQRHRLLLTFETCTIY